MRNVFAFAAIAIVLPFGAGCEGETKRRPAVERGEALFGDADLSQSEFNRFACSTCHSRGVADEPGLALAGHPLGNSANRPTWWNGYEPQYLDAVNFCLVFFMRGQPLEPGDPLGDALYEYLVSISPEDPSPALPWTVVKAIQLPPPGVAADGLEVYDRSCANCHGAKGSGKGRLGPDVTKLDAALSASYDQLFPGVDHDLVVTEKIRHGQFFGIGGNMPPFSTERLPDDELADLLAYLDL